MKTSTLLKGSRGQRQRGAVAIMFGLTLVVLIGFAGLAIDLGRFFVIKTELQNAMDACALSASSQLRPGQNNPNALSRAVAYGRVFSTGGVDSIAAIQNKANFQSVVVNIQPDQITFSETLGGTYQSIAGGANYNSAVYVKCTYPLTGLPIFFMKVLNPLLTTQTVSAMAAATLAPSSSSCAIPVGLCKVPGTSATSTPPFGLIVGEWLKNPDGPYGTGNFGWIDFSPPKLGVPELAALLRGEGQCSVALGTPVGEAGKKVSLVDEWNARFGSYRPGGPTSAESAPDVTGYSYDSTSWLLGANAYAGVSGSAPNYGTASGINEPLQYSPPSPYYALDRPQHAAGQLYRRVTVAPIVDCTVWNKPPGNAMPKLEGWGCVLMLAQTFDTTNPKYALEYRGLSTAPGSPCSTNGEPGTFGPLVPQLVQ